MKKTILAFSLCLLLGLVFYASSTSATFDFFKHGSRNNFYRNRVFNPDNQLSKSKCENATGNPVINVTQKVRNDLDDGEAGNNWAFDYYTRHIRVWSTGGDTYCTVVTYNGDFHAVPDQVGPGNEPAGELIDGPVSGKMSGGYRATFTGTLSGSPAWSTNGNVGTVNYKCLITLGKNDPANCTGRIDWIAQYFPGYTGFTYGWWGWQYRGGSHGTWINSQDGNSGNIL